jgi:hypothetical protein
MLQVMATLAVTDGSPKDHEAPQAPPSQRGFTYFKAAPTKFPRLRMMVRAAEVR